MLRVVDGDTVDAELDLGFFVHHRARLRLLGIDTPEPNATDPAQRLAAQSAKARLLELLAPADGAFTARTEKDKRDSFGRFLVEITLPDGRIANDILVEEGHAVPYRR